MNDTPSSVERRMAALMAAKTPAERVEMGASMYDASRAMTEARIRKEHPEWTAGEVRREIFLIYYRSEFGEEERGKIGAWLMGI